jgi:NADP-dependent 3-hydroxy acid dehydrogenase YdfG
LALGRDALDAADGGDLQRMIDVNVSAFLHVARLSIAHLKKSKGHLVNIGSIAGKEVYAGGATYCATKHFVHAINDALRHDIAGSGVRVTEIAPGAVDTEFSAVRFKGDKERAKKVYEGYTPLHAEDIADAIWYAISRPAHVNVQHILIMPTAQASVGNIARS